MQPAALTPLYVFLDFDGVIRNFDDTKRHDRLAELFPNVYPYTLTHYLTLINDTFDQKAIKNLDRLLEEVAKVRSVFVVIVAAARAGSSKEALVEAFKDHKFSHYVIDKTPDKITKPTQCKHKDTFCRAGQIQEWLQEHPDVIDYVIIDDHDFHLWDNFKSTFYQISYTNLLTAKDVDHLIKRFTASSDVKSP